MADLVMEVKRASAQRSGRNVIVHVAGESANSRDEVYAETSHGKDGADVYVRVRPAQGMGTQITGPFSLEASIEDAADVKTIRIHSRGGVKTVKV